MSQATTTLRITTPLAATFGAEVSGIDLGAPVSEETAAELRALFGRALLLVFRDQHLSPEAHIAFSRLFGELEIHVLDQYNASRYPELFVLSNVGPDGRPNRVHPDRGTLVWHTDASWSSRPAYATLLYSEAAPRQGGHTLFADTLSAFEALSEEDQARFAGLRAVHDLNTSREKAGYGPMPAAQREKVPPIEHPVVRLHPSTGRRGLFLGSHAHRIVGLSDAESAGTIERLMAHITELRFVHDHTWRAGDLVMWDNRAVLHRATEYDTAAEPRIVRRTVVKG